jgi:DNA-binding GntR family transcriptional regulator
VAEESTRRRATRKRVSDSDIYDRVFAAILDRRLPPGAHLREEELAKMFDVSRTKVRQALGRLFQVGLLETRASRGVAVAQPTRTQAREIFELRRMVEPAIAAEIANRNAPDGLDQLRDNLRREAEATACGDEATQIRTTGEFHLKLAELMNNQALNRMMLELEARTCLVLLSYARSSACTCIPTEHAEILEAISVGEGERAARLMTRHLNEIMAGLDLAERPVIQVRLPEALGLGDRPPRAGRRKRLTKMTVDGA